MARITRIIDGKLVDIDPTDRKIQQGSHTAGEYYRREQKTKFRKELVQRVEPREYIKAYGVEKAREFYTDEQIRKYS